jgi:hypothetical protein
MTVKQLQALLSTLPGEAHIVIAPTRFLGAGRAEVKDVWRDRHGVVCLVTGPEATDSDWEDYRADRLRKQTQAARKRLSPPAQDVAEEVVEAIGEPCGCTVVSVVAPETDRPETL